MIIIRILRSESRLESVSRIHDIFPIAMLKPEGVSKFVCGGILNLVEGASGEFGDI